MKLYLEIIYMCNTFRKNECLKKRLCFNIVPHQTIAGKLNKQNSDLYIEVVKVSYN